MLVEVTRLFLEKGAAGVASCRGGRRKPKRREDQKGVDGIPVAKVVLRPGWWKAGAVPCVFSGRHLKDALMLPFGCVFRASVEKVLRCIKIVDEK